MKTFIPIWVVILAFFSISCQTALPKDPIKANPEIYEIVYSDGQVKAEVETISGFGTVITQKNDGEVVHYFGRQQYNRNEIWIFSRQNPLIPEDQDHCVLVLNSSGAPILILPNSEWAIRNKS